MNKEKTNFFLLLMLTALASCNLNTTDNAGINDRQIEMIVRNDMTVNQALMLEMQNTAKSTYFYMDQYLFGEMRPDEGTEQEHCQRRIEFMISQIEDALKDVRESA